MDNGLNGNMTAMGPFAFDPQEVQLDDSLCQRMEREGECVISRECSFSLLIRLADLTGNLVLLYTRK